MTETRRPIIFGPQLELFSMEPGRSRISGQTDSPVDQTRPTPSLTQQLSLYPPTLSAADCIFNSHHLYGISTTGQESRNKLRTRIDGNNSLITQMTGTSDRAFLDFFRDEKNSEIRNEARRRTTRLIAGDYNIPLETAEETLTEYALLADNTIDIALRDMYPHVISQGETSIIRSMHHPFDLMLYATDPLAPKLERYRAFRKLDLIRRAAELESREKELNTQDSFDKFNNFVESVLDPESKTDREERFVLSTHETAVHGKFTTMSARIITKAELDELPPLVDGQKLTPVRRRTFTIMNSSGEKQQIPIYFLDTNEHLVRRKSRESMILKTMRKDSTITKAVDDQLGMMPIFEEKEHVELFLEHMASRANEADSLLERQDIEDTLDGSRHIKQSAGSSADIHWYKCHLRFFNIRPEFIGFTPEFLTDYLYRENDAHEEYSARRLFKDGVMERLVPSESEMWDYDSSLAFRYVVNKIRRRLHDKDHILGRQANVVDSDPSVAA